MSPESKKRTSSQAGLFNEDCNETDFSIHNDSDDQASTDHDSGDEDPTNAGVESRQAESLREISGNGQKVLDLPPPAVDDAGIADGRPGAENDRESAVDADDEREASPVRVVDENQDHMPPVEADEHHEIGEAKDLNQEYPGAVEGDAEPHPERRKIKRRKKYEAEADHSEAIRNKYREMRKTRTPIACDRCKNLRKECTSHEDGCSQCKAANQACMHTDPITLKSEKRGASAEKDRLIEFLKEENRRLRHRLKQLGHVVPRNPFGLAYYPGSNPSVHSRSPPLQPRISNRNTSSSSSLESDLKYTSRTGYPELHSHNGTGSSRRAVRPNAEHTAKDGGGHAVSPSLKGRQRSDDSIRSPGSLNRYGQNVADLEKRLGPSQRAKIESAFEKYVQNDPDIQRKHQSYPSPPVRGHRTPPVAPFSPNYANAYGGNGPYFPPLPAGQQFAAAPGYMMPPPMGFVNPTQYIMQQPPLAPGQPAYGFGYNGRSEPGDFLIDSQLGHPTQSPDNSLFWDLPDNGESGFDAEDLEFNYKSHFPTEESTSASAPEQARPGTYRLKHMPPQEPSRENPPQRPRKR
ncbi:Zn(II)2Cys6 transcription factor domain-containing protein [Aspergillus saccharolyticus JOP 1030-1]|uniref:Zn(2)-C6 fungal-type domain-containing protein n=1 Tax=Aspergillus saccharolyticus JOP 1030-1 TaxID=1450539 RepID=A0A318ZCL7_9EURO|nr:hypothetical protein BP01DRAFT_385481 [Aspergillus saccharolyticus JOP 1030-1]PYH42373.1 hypothetical protein BP01DRAFT_385481 [Aspergillus saccharolyticus JOP 1030-1]